MAVLYSNKVLFNILSVKFPILTSFKNLVCVLNGVIVVQLHHFPTIFKAGKRIIAIICRDSKFAIMVTSFLVSLNLNLIVISLLTHVRSE